MELGQKIIVNKKYVSERVFEKEHGWIKRYRITNIKEKQGIFVGFRVLREGDFDYETYKVLKNIKVALVATDKRGVFYTPIESLKSV